jgi:metal-responsive CopG/Arc/MetJ family transcriptional regulator
VRIGVLVLRPVYRYTPGMPSDRTIKTAVSLPQRLFEATERAARRRGVPRSRIFVEALEHHLADEEESDITAQINASLAQPMTEEEAEEEAAAEAFVAEAARRLLPDWEWKGDRPR